ncbi:MAG: hypothetical protein A2X13_15425 [Bacteroidetes bacterium GWC2_33_15]|nr:MAG: hypothetical protein A2X13_15425 [Bacteroidetes bacterium GWC2_33_15]OFX70083.1 MAG: hypothetical protein A2X14_05735 [Bacteroidetes bacterium GWD2_33_33]
METKLISIYLFIYILFVNSCNAQNNEILRLDEITIDTISLEEARYIYKDFGKVKNEKTWIEDYEDYTRKFTEYKYDSIEVLIFSNSTGKKFTNWIKITGSNHQVKINGNIFQVNDSISTLKEIYFDIYNDYIIYTLKNKNIKNNVHFGKPIFIINKYNKNEYYLGSLKFGIHNGVIKEIIIDLRTEGDYD